MAKNFGCGAEITQDNVSAERRARGFQIPNLLEVLELVSRGALFVVNHSAGKDSQAMMAVVRSIVPDSQILVIHADLGEDVEWSGVQEHIRNTIDDLPLIVTKATNKTLLSMVEERGMWPDAQRRQCTSDLKRGPIEREIRRYLKVNPQFNGLIVNCMGLRAQESSSRAKKPTLKLHERNSVAGREWYDWLPIHDMLLEEVWKTIADAGQEPHFAYGLGMSRLSCVFCIMASLGDLTISAKANPFLYAKHVHLEKKIGHTMAMDGRGLEERTGIYVDSDEFVDLIKLAA